MAQFVVRNVDEIVKRRISARAKRNGRSMEEEVREILKAAVRPSPRARKKKQQGFGTAFASHFRDLDEPFELPKWEGDWQPVKFEE